MENPTYDMHRATTSRFPVHPRLCRWAGVALLLLGGCSLPKNTWFTRSDKAQQLATRARQAQESGDCKQAEHLLTAAVETNPRDSDTRMELSDLLLEQGSCDAAVKQLRQVIRQDPDDPRPVVRLAEAMRTRGDAAEASRLVNQALKLDPALVDALLLRGALYEDRKQDDAALSVYCRAYQVDRDCVAAHLRMAAIHLRQQQPRQAGPLLRGLLERSDLTADDRTEAEWLLGQCYAREKRWPEAVQVLNQAANRRRMSAEDWYQLAFAAWSASDRALARQAIDSTLQLDPQHRAALMMDELLGPRVVRSD